MTKIEFITQLKTIFPHLTDVEFNLFEVYKTFLQTENKKLNLTRLDSEELIYEKYFYMSIVPFKDTLMPNLSILDIGSGSGIPGVLLKIIQPSIQLVIIESSHKKVVFMQNLCKELGFDDVTFINERAEICAHSMIEQFDIVTSRAVCALNVMLEMACQFVKIGGIIIEPKSINYQEELNAALFHLESFGLAKEKIFNFDDHNAVLIFKKVQHSEIQYPREWKVMIKNHKKVNMHE